MHVYIIAEAGVNHNGDMSTAQKMITAAKNAGADAIKFQSFIPEAFVTLKAEKASYQKKNTKKSESQLSMLKRLALSCDDHVKLFSCCKKLKIDFLSSPFDLDSIDMLHNLGLAVFKIPSGEITNYPYLKKIGKLKKRVILSTGMSTLGEIENAINLLAANGTRREHITVLHCNTEYPTPYSDVNLRAMITIRNAFNINVGLSDHTQGIEVAIASAALGASVIEKHFTLDTGMAGPDHKASLTPDKLKEMVRSIRNIEKSMGSGIKKPSPSEIKNKQFVRKSIVAMTAIKKGELFTEKNLALKRPASGLPSEIISLIIGQRAVKNFNKDDVITL
ncbi:N-acetylneuraminate synthase [Spirochaetota bacterium]